MQSPGSFLDDFQKLVLKSLKEGPEQECVPKLNFPLKQYCLCRSSRSSNLSSDLSNLKASACSQSQEDNQDQDQEQEMESQSDQGASLQNIFSYSNLVHAVSGAAGSVIAISVFYPLDTVRTRLQVDDHRDAKNTFQVCRDIFREEGLIGLFRGWSSLAGTMFVSSFVYFYAYASLKFISLLVLGQASPLGFIMRDLIIAFMAGVINVLLTTPLWVANTRLKLQGAKLHTSHYMEDKNNEKQYDGIIDCILKIVRKEGIQKLWGGTVPSLLLASNPAIQFMIYEALKRYFKRILHVQDLSALMIFLIGAISKTVATVVTYPLQVIQSRLRAGYAKHESSQTLLENIANMVRTRGIRFLYKGMEAKLFQTVLTAALMFLTYEKIAAFIFRMMGMQR